MTKEELITQAKEFYSKKFTMESANAFLNK